MQNKSRQPHPRQRSERPAATSGHWWRRGLLTCIVVVVAASAAPLIPRALSSREIAARLTHTITRGDLIVTVVEQGTVESSVNTEIKCKVRGAHIPIIWVIESGARVNPGDELVRLGTLQFDDRFNEVSKWVHMSRSGAERSRANVARAELAISEYEEGRYRTQLMTMEKDLAIAESNLRTARDMLSHAHKMVERGYVTEMEVEDKTTAVEQAELAVEGKKTEIDVLKRFTKAMQLETLTGDLKAARATLAAAEERVKQSSEQLILTTADLDYCVVKAEKSGMVIHPTAEPWKYSPEIKEGATVYMGQTLLLMPDLSKMQVKVGIRESIVAHVRPGLDARVALPGQTLRGKVSTVASVAGPATWRNGNVVRYDTAIELPPIKDLKPGMSAEVEIIVARHEDVLTIPVAAVVETVDGDFCWVKTADGVQRRSIGLGDTNDSFTIVASGLKEGDEIMLNPRAFVDEAQLKLLKSAKGATQPESPDSGDKAKPQASSSAKEASDSDKPDTKTDAA